MMGSLKWNHGSIFYQQGDFGTTVLTELQVKAIRMVVKDEIKKADKHNNLSAQQAKDVAQIIEKKLTDTFDDLSKTFGAYDIDSSVSDKRIKDADKTINRLS